MSFLFGSKAQRTFKKIQDLASGDMVDQAAVMIEEELDTLLEDHDISAKLVPFLMDIGHPDLGGRIGERVVRRHSDLRMSITRLLEEKQAQFPRSFELLRVIWKARLHQRDFNGLMDILGRTERVTIGRFAESVKSSAQTLNGVRGRELGAGIDRILAWAMITLHQGNPSDAMDILVDAARRCSFPEESLSRLSGWIAARTGGTDMEVNLKRVEVLTAIGDHERAIAELPSLYEAEKGVIDRAVALVEKELVPHDKTPKSTISLSRLMARSGRVNEACLMLDPLLDRHRDSAILEQAVTGLLIGAPGSARANLLQARLRLMRGENTQALDSIERAFSCPDVAESPVVDICRSFIDSGTDRDGLVTGKLGEFLVERGTVEEAVRILALRAKSDPDWVFEKLQLLLKRDRTSAAVLTLLAVVLLVLNRAGEATATLKHLSARRDVKSRQDIVSVLSDFDDLMGDYTELRRLRAASGSANGSSQEAAKDWVELLIAGEKISDSGYMAIYDTGVYVERAGGIVEAGFEPDSPASELVMAASLIKGGSPEKSEEHLAKAIESEELLERVTSLVSSLPFSAVAAMKPGKLFKALNLQGRGEVVAKLLPLLASSGSENWMDELAAEIVLESERKTAFFRVRYFVELDKPGTAAASVENLNITDDDIRELVLGCAAAAAGDIAGATAHLSKAASGEQTASMAKSVLSGVVTRELGSSQGAMALARAEVKTGGLEVAASTLKPFLEEKPVLDFLEEILKEVPSAHILHGSLALARLYAGDAEGFMRAAGTALEGNPELAGELVEAGTAFSLDTDYPEGLIFAAEAGLGFVENYDPEKLLVRALTLKPQLHGRVEALGYRSDLLDMLVALATLNSSTFKAVSPGEVVDVPEIMVSAAHREWKEQNALRALEELEKLAGDAGHSEELHRIRVSIAMAGEDRSEALLEDALSRTEWSGDFLVNCSSSEAAARGVERLLSGDPEQYGDDLLEKAVEMLVRCGAREALYQFAHRLLDAGSERLSGAAGKIVDLFLPTAGEEGSLSVQQVVKLLLLSSRTDEAFSLARGDSALLAAVRNRVSELDSVSVSPESLLRTGRLSELPGDADPLLRGEALWRQGNRRAACGVWKKAWEENGNPSAILRLYRALESMGSRREALAVKRIVSEKHPDLLREAGMNGTDNSRYAMISCNI